MATVSSLTQETSVDSDDLLYVVADGTSKSVSVGDLGGSLSLGAIDASIADTAVDVFVYDTSKDSAPWRNKTQSTSWYGEPLGTATRGSRAMFPAVAVIVAEAGAVNIYDGDDPALPLWKEFAVGATNPVFAAPTSVSALNAVIAIGTGSGLVALNLFSDTATKYTTGADETYLGWLAVDGAGWS